jgi:hypothetical protein
MNGYDEDWDEEEWDEEGEDWDSEEESDCPYETGFNCDPDCPYWGGDGICEIAIQEQVENGKEYREKHVYQTKCPVCGRELTCYEVLADELWTWNPGWHDPLIALEIYGPADMAKGVVHSSGNIYHIWVGEPRNEKLVKLIGGG